MLRDLFFFFAANQREERRTSEAALHQEEPSHQAQATLLRLLPKTVCGSLEKAKTHEKETHKVLLFCLEHRSWRRRGRRAAGDSLPGGTELLQMFSQPRMELPPPFQVQRKAMHRLHPSPSSGFTLCIISSLRVLYHH